MINIEHIALVFFIIPIIGMLSIFCLQGIDSDVRYCTRNIGVWCYSFIAFVCIYYLLSGHTIFFNKSNIFIYEMYSVFFILLTSIAFIVCILINDDLYANYSDYKTNESFKLDFFKNDYFVYEITTFKKNIFLFLLISCFINCALFSNNLLVNYVFIESTILIYFFILQNKIKLKKLMFLTFTITSFLFLFCIVFIDLIVGSLEISLLKTYPFNTFDKNVIYSILLITIAIRAGAINFFHIKNIRTSRIDENILLYSIIILLNFCFIIKILQYIEMTQIVKSVFSNIFLVNISLVCIFMFFKSNILNNLKEAKKNNESCEENNNLNLNNLEQEKEITSTTKKDFYSLNSLYKLNYNSYYFIIFINLICILICTNEIQTNLKNFFAMIIFYIAIIINLELFNHSFKTQQMNLVKDENLIINLQKHTVLIIGFFIANISLSFCFCSMHYVLKILMLKSLFVFILVMLAVMIYFFNFIKTLLANIMYNDDFYISKQRFLCMVISFAFNVILWFCQFTAFFEQISI